MLGWILPLALADDAPRPRAHLAMLLVSLVVMFVACLLACFVPARRAMAVNPIDALRAE